MIDFLPSGMIWFIMMAQVEDVLEMLEEVGIIPDEVRERILGEKDLEVLTAWLRLAAKTNSIEEFQSKMQGLLFQKFNRTIQNKNDLIQQTDSEVFTNIKI